MAKVRLTFNEALTGNIWVRVSLAMNARLLGLLIGVAPRP